MRHLKRSDEKVFTLADNKIYISKKTTADTQKCGARSNCYICYCSVNPVSSEISDERNF